MNLKLEEKLKTLPTTPGVYFHKSKKGEIIYVGKAAVLKNRVKQYFQKSKTRDAKTELLVSEIDMTDWIEVESEIEALFLESEMIKRYMPRYNILLRDDKHYQYVRIDYKAKHPTVSVVHRPADDGAQYYGPYIKGAREALKVLRKIFPFDYTVPKNTKNRATLHYHLGMSPGIEAGKTTLAAYKSDLKKLSMYLKGKRVLLEKQLKNEMEKASKKENYEIAGIKRNQLRALKRLKEQVIFSRRELFDMSKDEALNELVDMLGLESQPHRIEGYDISHQSGTNNVASMVVFTNGISDKGEYRKYKMKLAGNDDFAHMNEVITRRLSDKNRKKWPDPDLILIDGGKGQLSSALAARDEAGLVIPMISLAKRFETIIVPSDSSAGYIYEEILLSETSHVRKLLQRIRDESHRFAVSYHTSLKRSGQTRSQLEGIPGFGPATRKKLLRNFGSVRGIKNARKSELEQLLGPAKSKILRQYLKIEADTE